MGNKMFTARKKVHFFNECNLGDCLWAITYFNSILEVNDIDIVFYANPSHFKEIETLVHPAYLDRVSFRPIGEVNKETATNTWLCSSDNSCISNLHLNNHEINGMCFTMFKGISERLGLLFPMKDRSEFVFDHPWHLGTNEMLEKEGIPEFLFVNSTPMSGQFTQNDEDLRPLYDFLKGKKTFVTKRVPGFPCTLDYGLNFLQIGQVAAKAGMVLGVDTGPLCASINKESLKKNRSWFVLIWKNLPGVVYNRVDDRFLVCDSADEVAGILREREEAKKPEVSVLLSLYKGEKYLETYLKRFEEQSFLGKTQLVICHNCPTEKEIAAIRDFDGRNPGVVKHIIKDKLTNWAESMNECVRNADADIFTIGNVDDIRFSDSLRQQFEFLKNNPDYNAVHGNFWIVNQFDTLNGWREIRSSFVDGHPDLLKKMVIGPFFIWRKSAMEDCGYFDEQYVVAADYDFAMRLARRGKIGALDIDLGSYLDVGQGLSTRGDLAELRDRVAIKERYRIRLDRADEQNFLMSKGVGSYSLSDFRWFGKIQENWISRFYIKNPCNLSNSAVVVVAAKNVEKWISKTISSVLWQTYKDLGIVVIDDCSEDFTYDEIEKLLIGRPNAVFVRNTRRKYALENIRFAIKDVCSNPDSVIFVVDGDDWLYSSTAIEEMMEQHKTADVVWSKYECTDGDHLRYCASNHLAGKNVRHDEWRMSHLRSFKKFLFDGIKDGDFYDEDGEYYKMACDLAVMIPIAEQAPFERCRFYDKALYMYNRDNPINDDKVNRAEQQRMERRIRGQSPYSLHSRYTEKAEKVKPFQVPSPIKVSVIVKSYNRLSHLKLTLDSFYGQSVAPHEVIVADDGSTDGTVEWLEEIGNSYPFPVRYITRKHLGYRVSSLSVDAVRHVTGDRILFTDADVIHNPRSVGVHAALQEKELGVGIIRSISQEGVAQISKETVLLFDQQVFPIADAFNSNRTNLKFKGENLNQCPVAVWGGNFSISTKLYREIGGHDISYDVGWGGEDSDIGRRAVQAGANSIWCDDSIGFHLDHHVFLYSYRQKGSGLFFSGGGGKLKKIYENVDVSQFLIPEAVNEEMIPRQQLLLILNNIFKVCQKGIEGDVVELGCANGRTSLAIQLLLDKLDCGKKLFLYDSFDGLPDKHEKDGTTYYDRGWCRFRFDGFLDKFRSAGATIPTIHQGWFKEIDKSNYPPSVSFAFLDGDFYTSIIDSLEIIYPRLQAGGIVVIHDYESEHLPGVKAACDDFFLDKREKMKQGLPGVGIFEKM